MGSDQQAVVQPTLDMSKHVREVRDDELAFYRENGWAKLDSLITPAFAAELLETLQTAMGEGEAEVQDGQGPASNPGQGKVIDAGYWRDFHFIARDEMIDPFYSFVFSKEMGRNAQRVAGRDVPIRYANDLAAVKMPGPVGQGNSATTPHQDMPSLPYDRVGGHIFWIALDEVTPERGSLRFQSGSHKLGPLGRLESPEPDVLELYRDLLAEECETSPPLTLKPGDATIHHNLVVHDAPPNTTDKPRWAYIVAYVPADVRYTGVPNYNFDNIGLEPLGYLDHPRFPIFYP